MQHWWQEYCRGLPDFVELRKKSRKCGVKRNSKKVVKKELKPYFLQFSNKFSNIFPKMSIVPKTQFFRKMFKNFRSAFCNKSCNKNKLFIQKCGVRTSQMGNPSSTPNWRSSKNKRTLVRIGYVTEVRLEINKVLLTLNVVQAKKGYVMLGQVRIIPNNKSQKMPHLPKRHPNAGKSHICGVYRDLEESYNYLPAPHHFGHTPPPPSAGHIPLLIPDHNIFQLYLVNLVYTPI